MNFLVQFPIVNRVVQHEELDRVFASLSDATRRGILVRLGEGPATIGELAEPVSHRAARG